MDNMVENDISERRPPSGRYVSMAITEILTYISSLGGLLQLFGLANGYGVLLAATTRRW
jgi:hypothetical protein